MKNREIYLGKRQMHSAFILVHPMGACQEICNILFTSALTKLCLPPLTKKALGAMMKSKSKCGEKEAISRGARARERLPWAESGRRGGDVDTTFEHRPERVLPKGRRPAPLQAQTRKRNRRRLLPLNPGGTAGFGKFFRAGYLPQSFAGAGFYLPRRKGVPYGKD